MKTKYISLLFTVLISILFFSCEKDTALVTKLDSQNIQMKTYDSYQEYSDELIKKSSMTLEELKNYEVQNNFYSYGRKAEEIYFGTDHESFENEKDIITFVKDNSKYLQLINDEEERTFVVTKSRLNPDIYIANDDGMFRVLDNVHKVVGNFTIYTNIENINKLNEINEENYMTYVTDQSLNFPDYITNNQQKLALTYYSNSQFNNISYGDEDDEGIRVEVLLHQVDVVEPTSGFSDTYLRSYHIARPMHKTAGIWFWCTRTMWVHFGSTVKYLDVTTNGGARPTWQYMTTYEHYSNVYDTKISKASMKWLYLDADGSGISGNCSASFTGLDVSGELCDHSKAKIEI